MKVSPVVVAFVLSLGSWTAGLIAQQPSPAPASPPQPPPPKSEAPPPAASPLPPPPPRVVGNPTGPTANNALWNVAVDVQMIALPQDLSLTFIADLQSAEDAKVEAAVGQLQDLLKKKQAILLGWPRAIGVEGSRVTTETIVEQRYPTEWNPSLLVPDPPATPPAPKPQTSVSPTAFETRNVGATLEAESTVLNDGREIVLTLTAQRVSLREMERFTTGLSKDGAEVHVEQPQFTNSRLTTTLKLRSGQHVLVGTHLLTKPENHIEFVIARAVSTRMR